MKIAVQTGGMTERLGCDATYRMIKEAGFDGVDANLDHIYKGGDVRKRLRSPLFDGPEEDLLDFCRQWKDGAEKYGLDNYQAHAPFPSALPVDAADPEFNDYLIDCLIKTIKCCDYIGCHKLVVHPFFYGMPDKLSAEAEWEQNIAGYSRLIEAAKRYDVIICLENMFNNYKGKIYKACCSDFDTACRYVDTLNGIAGEKRFGFCLDTGHALLVGEDICDVMVKLGDRIEAFHVHDNNGLHDQHLAPYMGILDWDRFIAGLARIGFDETLSFETFRIWSVYDSELCPDVMKLLAKTGRMFASRARAIYGS